MSWWKLSARAIRKLGAAGRPGQEKCRERLWTRVQNGSPVVLRARPRSGAFWRVQNQGPPCPAPALLSLQMLALLVAARQNVSVETCLCCPADLVQNEYFGRPIEYLDRPHWVVNYKWPIVSPLALSLVPALEASRDPRSRYRGCAEAERVKIDQKGYGSAGPGATAERIRYGPLVRTCGLR